MCWLLQSHHTAGSSILHLPNMIRFPLCLWDTRCYSGTLLTHIISLNPTVEYSRLWLRNMLNTDTLGRLNPQRRFYHLILFVCEMMAHLEF